MKWYLTKPAGTTLSVWGDLSGLITTLDGGAQRPAQPGDVASCDTSGHLIGRPSGTNGDWEQVGINGGCAVFNPQKNDPTHARAFVFGYQPSVPGGFGAISQEPLA